VITTLHEVKAAVRRVPTRWVRTAVALGSGTVFGAALMGSLMISRAPTDLDSFGGGYSYVSGRSAVIVPAGIDPLAACQAYVEESMYLIDGYHSGDDFLNGCRAAAGKRQG
jgi:hypothetical protein